MKRIGLNIKTENNGNRVVIYQKSKSKKTDIAIATIFLDDMEREVEFHFTPSVQRMGKKPNHKRNIKKIGDLIFKQSSIVRYTFTPALRI